MGERGIFVGLGKQVLRESEKLVAYMVRLLPYLTKQIRQREKEWCFVTYQPG